VPRQTRPPATEAVEPPGPSLAAGPADAAGHPGVSYQQKFVRCNKPACRRCADGPGHGPYWYAFWWEGGRTRSRYLGKISPVSEILPTPDETPERVTPVSAPAPALRVVTLGRFAVWRDGEKLAENSWPRRKATALFKLLLGAPAHRLPRDQVLDLLWPDADVSAAAVGLRGAIHAARRTLDPPGRESVIQVHGGVVGLSEDIRIEIDATLFAQAATAALAGRAIDACRAALALYGGEYLPDDRYEDWAVQRREELAELRLAVLLHQARLCGELGDLAEARDALAAVLAIDPAHEEATCKQMTILAAMGERTEALRVFDQLQATLRKEYGLDPGHEVMALALRLRNLQPARLARPAPPQTPRATNLAAAPSTFIGRKEAQRTVVRLLETSRLVTLTGAGGSGKTRLATHVAESLLASYPDGVWLCELAGLAPFPPGAHVESTADPVAGAVAGAMGLLEDPGRPLVETMGDFLEPRHMLLVVDNAEHVLDPVAHLVSALLARCPRLTILVTSREALGLPDEVVWSVPPLALPASSQHCVPEELETYDAIRLFVARARTANPALRLDAATAPLVLEISQRLEGIPLAIELAAARLAFLSLETLAARLDDRFRLLVGGSRIALPRQQTLRATMDWSYSLLGSKERTLLRRLTVFAGGWTLAAAEGICTDAELPLDAILDALGGLVAKSLVVRQDEDETTRYALLETVRQFGQLKLAETQEEQGLRARHLAWFAQQCETAISAWGSTDQAALLHHLDTELENIRAALAWGLGAGDAVQALRLTSALSRYWTTRGLVHEGRRWTTRTLEAAPDAPVILRATALNRCAILARMEGDESGAGALWEASLALFRTLGDMAGIARVLMNLGLLHYDLGDDVAAIAVLTESLTLKRQLPDQSAVADGLLNLGMVYTRQRQYAEAEAALSEATAIWQASGDQANMGSAYLHTGHLARDQEQWDRAVHLYAASVRISLTLGDRPRLASALEGMAHVLMRRPVSGMGNLEMFELSTQLFACAAVLRESAGVPVPPTSQHMYQANLQRLQASLGTPAFEAAWTAGWDAPVLELIERLPA
jgi:predicted ATPase/DNA-binding SARP family transcriptional activator